MRIPRYAIVSQRGMGVPEGGKKRGSGVRSFSLALDLEAAAAVRHAVDWTRVRVAWRMAKGSHAVGQRPVVL